MRSWQKFFGTGLIYTIAIFLPCIESQAQSVESILRALQDRQTVVNIKQARLVYSAAGLQPIHWTGLSDYPAEGDIQTVQQAIISLNEASRWFDALKGNFLAFDPGKQMPVNQQNVADCPQETSSIQDKILPFATSPFSISTSPIYTKRGMPLPTPAVAMAPMFATVNIASVGTFDLSNWRKKLPSMASNVNQLTAIEWPYYGHRISSGCRIVSQNSNYVTLTDDISVSSNSFPFFDPLPPGLTLDTGSGVPPAPLTLERPADSGWNVMAQWTLHATDEADDSVTCGQSSFDKVAMPTHPITGMSVPSAPIGGPVLLLTTPMIRAFGDLTERAANRTANGFTLGTCDISAAGSGNDNPVDGPGLPSGLSDAISTKIKPDLSVSGLSNMLSVYIDGEETPAHRWANDSQCAVEGDCVYLPAFTQLTVGGGEPGIAPGEVETTMLNNELIRIHLGRGAGDLTQVAWLGSRADAFGSLTFNGSASAFEVLQEEDYNKFEDDPIGGKTYDSIQEFSDDQIRQSGWPSRFSYIAAWFSPRLRQVKGADVLADIHYSSPYVKTVSFYWAKDVGAKTGEFYSVAGLTPFKSVSIWNPSAGSGLPKFTAPAPSQPNQLSVEDGTKQIDITYVPVSDWSEDFPVAKYTFNTSDGEGDPGEQCTINVEYNGSQKLESGNWDITTTTDAGTYSTTVKWNVAAFPNPGGLPLTPEPRSPIRCDRPELASVSIDGPNGESRETDVSWSDPDGATGYCSPTQKVCTGADTWALNGHTLTFDTSGLSLSDSWTALGHTFVKLRSCVSNICSTGLTIDSKAVNLLSQVEIFNTLNDSSVTIGGTQATVKYSGPAGGDTPPWSMYSISYSNGLTTKWSLSISAADIQTQTSSTWGGDGLSSTYTGHYDLFGNLTGSTTVVDGITVDSVTGSNPTSWGAPKTLTMLRGDQTTAAYDTDGPLLGHLLSVTDAATWSYGAQGTDWKGRPTTLNAGLESFGMNYDDPKKIVGTGRTGYTKTTGISDFGDVTSLASSLGSESSFAFNPGGQSQLTIAGRSVSLNTDDSGAFTSLSGGLGQHGERMTCDVDSNQQFYTDVTVLKKDGSDSNFTIHTVYDALGRVVSRTQPSESGAMSTERWQYDDASRTVTYSPRAGPTTQTVTRTLSGDGRTLTINIGQQGYRITQDTTDTALSTTVEVNDDSNTAAPGWKTMSVQTVEPATGKVTTTPWGLSNNALTVTTSAPAKTGSITIQGGLTNESLTVSLNNNLPSKITGTSGGLPVNISSIGFRTDRLSSLSGTIGGLSVGASFNDDGQLTGYSVPGANLSLLYGGTSGDGASGYSVTVNNATTNETRTWNSDPLGNFEGSSGDGSLPVTVQTNDAPGGTSEVVNGNLTVNSNFYGSTTGKSYVGGLNQSTTLNDDGSVGGMNAGDGYATVDQSPTSTKVSYENGPTIENDFYNVGLRKEVTGPGDDRTFSYQNFQLQSEIYNAGLWAGYQVQWLPDNQGRTATLAISGPGIARSFTLNYDAYSRMTGSTSPELTSVLGRDNAGRPFSLTRSASTNGPAIATTGWTYDSTSGYMMTHTSTLSGEVISHGFGYDGRNRISTRTSSHGVNWTNMLYDVTNQLGTAYFNNGGTIEHATYNYDSRGNPSTSNGTITNTVNSLDQISSRALTQSYMSIFGSVAPKATVKVFSPLTPGGVSVAVDSTTNEFAGLWAVSPGGSSGSTAQVTVRGTLPGAGHNGTDAVADVNFGVYIPPANEVLVYDAAGRLKSDARWNYSWVTNGTLSQVTRVPHTSTQLNVASENVTYQYDADGRRTEKLHTTTYNDNSTHTEESQVLWAGWLPVLEKVSKDGVYKYRRWFQWGPDLSGTMDGAGGIGGLVAIIEEDTQGNSRTLLPMDDGLGNIVAVMDKSTGSIVARYDYDPFGQPLQSTGDVECCPFRWQTKWFDKETAQYYFGYRYYDPRLSRWLSRDPIGEAGGFNLYAYCGNDPVNGHDYLGLEDYTVGDDVETAGATLGKDAGSFLWFFNPIHVAQDAVAHLKAPFEPHDYGPTATSVSDYFAIQKQAIVDPVKQFGATLKDPRYAAEGYAHISFLALTLGLDPELVRVPEARMPSKWMGNLVPGDGGIHRVISNPRLPSTASPVLLSAPSGVLALPARPQVLALPWTAPVAYGTPFAQLSRKSMSRLEAKVDARTITRDEWDRLSWFKRLTDRRQAGIDAFWTNERAQLGNGLPGSRNWNSTALSQILAGGQPSGIFSHHRYSVSLYPQLANDPNFIWPATFYEHFYKWHGGAWRNPTSGAPLNPDLPDSF